MTQKEIIQEAASFTHEAIACLEKAAGQEAAEIKRRLKSILIDLETYANERKKHR